MWPFPRTSSGPERPGLALSLADDGAAPALRASPSLAAPCRNPLRERYIAARFCGVARGAADLRSPDAVIKAARLYFEEERSDLAVELLAIAEEESGGEPAFVLARSITPALALLLVLVWLTTRALTPPSPLKDCHT